MDSLELSDTLEIYYDGREPFPHLPATPREGNAETMPKTLKKKLSRLPAEKPKR